MPVPPTVAGVAELGFWEPMEAAAVVPAALLPAILALIPEPAPERTNADTGSPPSVSASTAFSE
ncbi:MAG: hypothetical protein ABSC93_13380 [Bryobacteraceae bacterium]